MKIWINQWFCFSLSFYIFYKGAFCNYVDKILAILTNYLPFTVIRENLHTTAVNISSTTYILST